eukprot:jgi/Mesvir1/24356/Mv11031-RA.1
MVSNFILHDDTVDRHDVTDKPTRVDSSWEISHGNKVGLSHDNPHSRARTNSKMSTAAEFVPLWFASKDTPFFARTPGVMYSYEEEKPQDASEAYGRSRGMKYLMALNTYKKTNMYAAFGCREDLIKTHAELSTSDPHLLEILSPDVSVVPYFDFDWETEEPMDYQLEKYAKAAISMFFNDMYEITVDEERDMRVLVGHRVRSGIFKNSVHVTVPTIYIPTMEDRVKMGELFQSFLLQCAMDLSSGYQSEVCQRLVKSQHSKEDWEDMHANGNPIVEKTTGVWAPKHDIKFCYDRMIYSRYRAFRMIGMKKRGDSGEDAYLRPVPGGSSDVGEYLVTVFNEEGLTRLPHVDDAELSETNHTVFRGYGKTIQPPQGLDISPSIEAMKKFSPGCICAQPVKNRSRCRNVRQVLRRLVDPYAGSASRYTTTTGLITCYSQMALYSTDATRTHSTDSSRSPRP